jgi:NAD+ synthase
VLTRFLRVESRRAGFERLVLGLSGGIDSAVVCFLAVRAVGAENVVPVAMPWRDSSPDSVEHARLVAGACGVALRTCDLTDAADGLLSVLHEPTHHRIGNVLARLRMVTLFDVSFEIGGLVLGTSNKTELLLGYGTLFGDLASALNPLGDIYKGQVRQLARHLRVPDEVVEKPPSADLWVGQTDEDELGFSYDDADALLHLLVDARKHPDDVVRMGFDRALVDRVRRLVATSHYKRRMPVIAKLSQHTIGWEYRNPRDLGS